LTVYRHFPDDEALFSACSSHWLSHQQLPDPASWSRHSDAQDRLATGLSDLYRFYRDGEAMLRRIYGDWDALPAEHRKNLETRDTYFRSVLLEPFPEPTRNDRLRAIVGHAVSFWTWRSLCHVNGLSNDDAVEAMSALITLTAAAREAPVPTGAKKAGIRTR
jgi:AcrR family transcriptional regulator